MSSYGQTFALVLLAVILSLKLATTAHVLHERRTLEETLAAHGEQARLTVLAAAAGQIPQRQFSELQGLFEALTDQSHVERIAFVHRPSGTAFDTRRPTTPADAWQLDVAYRTGMATIDVEGRLQRIVFPVDIAGYREGAAAVWMARPTLSDSIAETVWHDVYVAIVVLLLLLPLAHIVARRTARPLRDMARNAQRLVAGEFSNRPSAHALVEVRLLSAALTRAARRISGQNARIEAQVRAMTRLAYFDDVTGLANRKRFRAAVDAALRSGQPFAIVYIDLDGFKQVNDTLGHDVGDRLLSTVAARLSATVRQGPRDGARTDVVARLGGDEFALLLHDLPDEAAAVRAASRFRAAIHDEIVLCGQRMAVEASLGVALSPAHGTDYTALLKAADIAMYAAKRTDRQDASPRRIEVFSARDQAEAAAPAKGMGAEMDALLAALADEWEIAMPGDEVPPDGEVSLAALAKASDAA